MTSSDYIWLLEQLFIYQLEQMRARLRFTYTYNTFFIFCAIKMLPQHIFNLRNTEENITIHINTYKLMHHISVPHICQPSTLVIPV